MKAFGLVSMTYAIGEGVEFVTGIISMMLPMCIGGWCDVRLKTSFDRIKRILESVSSWRRLQSKLQGIVELTATKVESRLLELAATSVLYRFVQRFACSLLNTARDTSVRSLCLLNGLSTSIRSVFSRSGMLATYR